MATRQDEINARKELLRLQQEEIRLAEQKINIEEKLSQETDKRRKSARDLKDELERTNQSINRNSDQQLRQEKEINREKDERVKKEKVLLGLDKKINQEAKTSRNLEKSLLKSLDKGVGKIIEQRLGLKRTLELRKQDNDEIVEILSNKDKLKKLDAEDIESLKTQHQANNALGSLEQEIISQVEAGNFKHMDQQEILNRLEQQGIDLSKLSAEAKENLLNQVDNLVEGTENFTDEFQKGVSTVEQMDNLFDDLIEKSEKYGAVLKDSNLRMKAFQGLIIGAAASLAKDLFNAALNVRQEFGTTVTDSFKIAGNLKIAGLQAKLLGGNVAEAENAAKALVTEFGSLDVLTPGVSRRIGSITAQFGIGGENAAKLAKQLSVINGSSLDTSLNTIETVGNLARAARVAPAAVLNDLAESTESFAKFSADGGENLARAAIEARKLGLNLSAVDKIAESLLDFESSIEKQLEAQVLLGRQLNLDKARELSLAGDLEGVLEEVKNQVGGAEEFSKLNVIQRKALADSIGLEVSELSKLVNKQNEAAEAQEKQVKAATMLGVGIGAVVGLAAAIIPAIIGSIPGMQKIGFKQLAKGLAIGAAGAVGGGALGGIVGSQIGKTENMKDGTIDSKGNTVLTPKGSINLDKDDDIIAGTNLLSGGGESQPNVNIDLSSMESKMDSQIKESKEMNQNTKKLLEQNQFLMTKLIRTTGGLKGDA